MVLPVRLRSAVHASPPSGDPPDKHAAAAGRRHDDLVEFYETEDFLVSTVGDFVGQALDHGDAAIVVATGPHRSAFEAALGACGRDLSSEAAAGRYLAFDAAALLAAFMVGGSPDAARFRDVIGPIIEQASAGGRQVRVYGEMVALLWDAGDVAAAIALEDLWNDLAATRDFALLCAYPMRSFADKASAGAFQRICEQHTTVIPSEGYSLLDGADQEQRAVARLQQEIAGLRADAVVLRAAPTGDAPPAAAGDPAPSRFEAAAEQRISDREHAAEERDRAASDRDQTAADRDHSQARADERTSCRELAAAQRDREASNRDQTASDRDQSQADTDQRISSRDEAAVEREREAAARDHSQAEADQRAPTRAAADQRTSNRDRAAADRDRMATDRDQSQAEADQRTSDRDQAGADREQAAADREEAAADRAAATKDRQDARAELRHAQIDQLTGAFGRELGMVALEHEISRARRGNGRLVLAYVDVDGLKQVNDGHGHAAGDALLRDVVGAIQLHLRSYDPLVRVGGDEFVCVLGDSTRDEARRRFQAIGTTIEKTRPDASISVGFAALRPSDTLEQLTLRGDTALYDAKRTRAASAPAWPSI